MARFDKYEPHVGGFRARLNADWLDADVGVVRAVGLNASGLVVKGAGATGVKGVVALGLARKAGHAIDVMTAGEILDITDAEVGGAALAAGQNIYVTAATGALTTAATGLVVYVGFMVEIDRLIVRFGNLPAVIT